MSRRRFVSTTSKRPTNIRVRADLLAAARESEVDLSATLERALLVELATRKRQQWREDNRGAIRAYNKHVEKHDTFSGAIRSF